jgi:FlgD Ig-like domain/FG-GAP-like repeat
MICQQSAIKTITRFTYSLFLISLSTLLFSLQSSGGDKERALQALALRGVKITQIQNSIYKFEYPNGRTLYKDLRDVGDNNTAHSAAAPDSLYIDISTVDTTAYYSRFRLWIQMPLGLWIPPSPVIPFVADFDGNGKNEIYSSGGNPSEQGTATIYQYNSDSTISKIFEFPNDSTVGPLTVGDFDGDGLADLIYQHAELPGWLDVYTQPKQNSLPTMLKSIYDTISPGYAASVSAYDLEGDGRPELIYYMEGSGNPAGNFGNSNHIAKYNSQENKFELIYHNQPPVYTAAFAFGDLDMDGKQDIANGGIDGSLYIYKYQGGNSFSVRMAQKVPVLNLYLSTYTNDLDGDGKPELWIGGDEYEDGVGSTRIFILEPGDNGIYEEEYQIIIKGIFSFYAGNMQAVDIDNDGKDEVLLCVDQNVLIFKNTGLHSYELWYSRQNELALSGENSVIFAAGMEDLDNDGSKDLLVTMDSINYATQQEIKFTRVYKNNHITAVNPVKSDIPTEYSLSQNYPNPFNPSTIVEYTLPKRSQITITVYDILGKEVLTLANEEQAEGAYKVTWNGRDRHNVEVPAGVYFIRMQANMFTKTIKALLLK